MKIYSNYSQLLFNLKSQKKIEETYTMTDFNPSEENTHHSGGKKESRRGEEGEESEEGEMGGQKMKCQHQ